MLTLFQMKPSPSNPVVGPNQAILSIKMFRTEDTTSSKQEIKQFIQTTLVSEGYKNFTVKVVSLKRIVVYVNFVRAEVIRHNLQCYYHHCVNFSLFFSFIVI